MTMPPLAVIYFLISTGELLSFVGGEEAYFSPTGSLLGSEEGGSSWGERATYGNAFSCLTIPQNFTLCRNLDYSNMMVPNLLGHDSLQEADYHARSWVPLLGLQCHPDTQLFLCSLFSPICLDRPIYPCQSLCQGVQAKCEPRMLTYKYPWPSMFRCDQFPDGDLCIKPGAANNSERLLDEPDCPSCNQAHTCENIVDHFCRADFVFRAKLKRLSRGGTSQLEWRRGKWFKPAGRGETGAASAGRELTLDHKDNCCASKLRPGAAYLVMGVKRGDQNVATFVMAWNAGDKVLKNAIRTFRSGLDCSNPLPMSVGSESANVTSTRRRKRRRGGGGRSATTTPATSQYGGCRVAASSSSSTTTQKSTR
ncbi:secreted frizzled-related protein 5 [Folsomia candida]|uniref:secreted frizzled-related protein 5 n=1 Tax=Folsomia candida TaxID=158441 RepID=UPI000B8FB76D|nr:secreted frizzled-related protein 5 [Folsomia candida]